MEKHGFIARWGGEEFMLVFDNCKMYTAVKILENALEEVRCLNNIYHEKNIKVTMTFGVVEYHQKESLNKLFKKADTKLYYGKQRGRNQIVSKIRHSENL